MADTHHTPRTRAEAKLLGLNRYLTGEPCLRGHIAEKYTLSGRCITCLKERAAQARKTHAQQFGPKPNKRAKLEAFLAATGGDVRDYYVAYHRAYQIANREKIQSKKREWKAQNPEKCKSMQKAANAKRRVVAKAASLIGDSTAAIHDWEMSAKKVCYWCGCKCQNKWHLDHYVPMSKGGMHAIANLVISCGPCNFRKSAKDPYDFAQSVGRLF